MLFELTPPREWPTLGWEAIDWIEHYLPHGPGDVQGQPLILDNEFCQLVLDVYRLYPRGHELAGRRVVTYGGWSRPKGRAKSEIAGALGCFEFSGPCRFDGWDAAGKPVGKPVVYPFIRPLATEEGQTGNTYRNIFAMLKHCQDEFPNEWNFSQLSLGSTRVLWGANGQHGEIRPSTAGAASKDGGLETFAIADEVHLFILPELRQMHRMVRRNSRKRKEADPWMLATTTMYGPGENSVAEELHGEAKKMAQQERRHYGFLWSHRQGDIKESEWNDDKRQLESIALAYGLPIMIQVRKEPEREGDPPTYEEKPLDFINAKSILHDEIRGPDSVMAENFRYWHNLAQKGSERAIDPAVWDSRADPSRTPGPSKSVDLVLGFDGSKSRDSTVLIAWTVEEKPHLFLVKMWEKLGQKDWRVPRLEVRASSDFMFDNYNVRRKVCDPAGWQSQVDDWAEKHGEDANGDPLVLDFWTNQASKMGPAIDRFLDAVRDGDFTHDGSPDLRRHMLNAVKDKQGKYTILIKESEGLKIDGCVGSIIGYEELQHLPVAVDLAMNVW